MNQLEFDEFVKDYTDRFITAKDQSVIDDISQNKSGYFNLLPNELINIILLIAWPKNEFIYFSKFN